MPAKRFVNPVSFLRGIMIVLVVVGHTCTVFTGAYAGHVQIDSSVGRILRDLIYSFHMPTFMAISGFLFYREVLKQEGKKWDDGLVVFLLKKAKRLLLPFIVTMYCWRKPLLMLANRTTFSGLKDYLSFSTTGALWFLYSLFAIFVLQRVLIQLIWKNDLASLVTFAVLNIVGSMLSGPIRHLLVYNVYFFLGAFLHKRGIPFARSHRLVIVVLALISTVLLVSTDTQGIAKSALQLFAGTFNSITLMIICQKNPQNECHPAYTLSNYSMGIYLFHEPLMFVIGSFMLTSLKSSIAFVFLLSVIGIVGAMAVTWLLRKVGLKVLIGE